MKNNIYYIIAGEPSGDLHGRSLIKEIKKLDSSAKFLGLGGPLMQEVGLETNVDFKRLSVMGFFEVLKDIRFFLKLKKNIIKSIIKSKPNKIILIDYPGFNLSIAKSLKSILDVPIIYYISPQVWAWKKNRVFKIKKYIDKLIVVFPFEVPWFKKYGLDVKFFGHPLIDQFRAIEKSDKHKRPDTVALFPGSRYQEIKKHLPLLNHVAKKLKQRRPNLRFIMNISPGQSVEEIQSQLIPDISVVQKNSSDIFMSCSAAVVTSGTATLECAITETPFVVIYKASFFSWLIAKFLLSVPFICIVNLLANKEIVPELIQSDANAINISKKILNIIENPKQMKNDLLQVKNSLGDGFSYYKTAKYIIEYD